MSVCEIGCSPERAATAQPFIQNSKVTTRHLARKAIVYVRQSSTRQVRENVESTQLQYNLATRARDYGWPDVQIETIDDDLGVSAQSVEGREGFQRLLAEISLGYVGIVFGIEMSRLARNCRDWHQLLELCAVFDSLLGDADGIYNPRDHNDRLLLGLAELPPVGGGDSPSSVSHSRPIFTSLRDFDSETAIGDSQAWSYDRKRLGIILHQQSNEF